MPTLLPPSPHALALAIALTLPTVKMAHAQQSQAPLPPKTVAEVLGLLEDFANDPTIKTTLIATNSKDNILNSALGMDDDLLTLQLDGIQEHAFDGGEGFNVLRLEANHGATLTETRNFQGLDVPQGNWTVQGTGDFQFGALVRNSATLINQGTIVGDAFVAQGATYGGNGKVRNLIVEGTLHVNPTQGAAWVGEDLTLAEGSTLVYDIAQNGDGAKVQVEGTAKIDNAALTVKAADTAYPDPLYFTVIQAGKIEGEFGEVNSDLLYLTPALHYSETTVDLAYTRNERRLEDGAGSDNGREAANGLEPDSTAPGTPRNAEDTDTPLNTENTNTPDSPVNRGNPAGTGNGALDALLTSTQHQAADALEQLAGGANANLANITQNSARPVVGSLLATLRQGSDAPAQFDSGNGRVWVQALGNSTTTDRAHASRALQQRTHGVVVGADWSVNETWSLGLLGAKSQTQVDGRRFDADLDNWYLGAYAIGQRGPLALRLGATYGSHSGDTQRNLAFKGYRDTLKGSFDSSTQQAFAELGYQMGSANLSAEPFVSLGYERYQRAGYQEKGGDAALRVERQSRQNLNNTFGLRLAQFTLLDNGMALMPSLSAGWKHTYGDLQSKTRQSFVSTGKGFTIEGAAQDRDSLVLAAGLDLRLSEHHTLGVGYQGELSSNNRSNGLTGQWRMSF